MEKILSSAEKLEELFKPLCSSEEDLEILKALSKNVVEVRNTEIEFSDMSLIYRKNNSITPDISLPKSFSEITEIATTIIWDGGGPEVGFELSDDGTSCADGWLFDEIEEGEEYDEELVEKINSLGGPKDAFLGGQNALFFDPTRKLSNGEPAMAFISHEECDWVAVKSVDHLNYKQIFLRMIADAMISTNYIDELYF